MKTAVEYLKEIIYGDKEFSLSEVLEQAREMEKQQIIDAFEHFSFNLDDGEQYYNETFKSEL